MDGAEGVGVTSTEDSPGGRGVAGSGAGGGEPLKAQTVACAVADVAFSVASFNDPFTTDCTWVRCAPSVAPGLDAGVVATAVQEHFGLPCACCHLE